MLTQIKKLINDYLVSNNLKLISLKVRNDNGINIIEMVLDGIVLGVNQEQVHMDLLDLIDPVMPDGYYFELSPRGCEYELTKEDEILEHINTYVYLKSDGYVGYGIIKDYNKETKEIKLIVKEKTRSKEITLSLQNKYFLRTAVKM